MRRRLVRYLAIALRKTHQRAALLGKHGGDRRSKEVQVGIANLVSSKGMTRAMSEQDLPTRFAKYAGDHISLRRIALTVEQLNGLPSFPAADKKKDPRYKWFTSNHGRRCWELDALDPNALRDCVEREIVKLIEPVAWERCEVANRAEQESLATILANWK
jgi:hypothetical protein